MKAKLVSERAFAPSPGWPSVWPGPHRLADGAWQVQDSDTRLLVLDPALRSVRQTFALPRDGAGLARADLRCAAVLCPDRIMLVDQAGGLRWEVPHAMWRTRFGAHGPGRGSAAFGDDGDQLFVLVPGADAWADEDELWVLDTGTGQVLDRAPIGCATTGSAMLPHPDGHHLGLELGIPYGGWIGWARWADGQVSVRVETSPNDILVDIHPSGDRYLTVPLDPDAGTDTVTVRRFGDGHIEATRSPGEILGKVIDGIGRDIVGDGNLDEDFYFATHAGYLDADRVVATVCDGPDIALIVVLTADELALVDVVDYPEEAVGEPVTTLSRGTWATADPRTGRMQVWRL